MRRLWILLPLMLIAGLAIVWFSGNQIGCSKIKDAKGIGDCYVKQIDIPFDEDANGALMVAMSVDDRPRTIAMVDTGAFGVAINDNPTTDELKDSQEVEVTGATCGAIKEPMADTAVCVALTKTTDLCQVSQTIFGGEHSLPLLGQSFLNEFKTMVIDRDNQVIHLSGRTSDKPIFIGINGELYRLHFN